MNYKWKKEKIIRGLNVYLRTSKFFPHSCVLKYMSNHLNIHKKENMLAEAQQTIEH